MPTLVDLPSRKLQLVFPDKMSEDEIRTYVKDKYPTTGEDVAYRVEQANQQSLEGAVTVNPFEGENKMSRDDYILLKKHQAEKKSSLGDILGVATDVAGTVFSDIGNAIAETGAAALVGEFQPAVQSIGEGVAAGTVGLYDIANRILRPDVNIPTKEEFLKTQVPTGELEQRRDSGMGIVGPIPKSVMRPATEEDYNALIDREMQRDADAVNRLYLMEDIIRGAPIEEIARGASYLDATTIASLGSSTLAKTGVKTLFKPAVRVGVSTAPGRVGQAALTAAEKAAGAVETVASVPGQIINRVGEAVGNVFPGGAPAAKATAVTGAVMGDLGVSLAGAKTAETAAELTGTAARLSKGEASRAGLLERIALDPDTNPITRKIAYGAAQLSPVYYAAGTMVKEGLKDAAVGSAVGAGLGYLAEGDLEGAAAGLGAGFAIGSTAGVLRSSFDLSREMVGLSTSRTRQQATGDINRFIAERPSMEQQMWASTANKLADMVGVERAAAQMDALRIAEANGSTVRLATADEMKKWTAPGWVNSATGKAEIVLNPRFLREQTAAHETSHVLFGSLLNRSFKTEIEQAIFGVADPVTGNIVKPGIFDDISLANISAQIAKSYGRNKTAQSLFRGYAKTLASSTDNAKLAKARSAIADELVATYTEKLMGRLRPGTFNPDRLPLLYRKIFDGIDESVRNAFGTVLFEKGMNLRFDNTTKTLKDANGKTIRIPELDALIKNAFSRPEVRAARAAKVKPDLIPVSMSDRAVWARSYGGAKGILNDDLTPKSISQINDEALRRWQDKTQRLSALPDTEKIGLEFSKDKNGQTVVTARGKLSQAAIDIIVKGDALDDSAEAVLRGILDSWQTTDKATFDTRYYGVYDRGKGSSKMVAGVKSASQNEILPYSIEANSKDGIIIRAVDMTKVRERLSTALNKPQFKDLYKNPAEALSDFKLYLDNLTKPVAMESAMLFGGGEIGAKKRNLFYDTLGFRLRSGESLVNVPESTIAKSQNTIKSYRVERFAKLQESGFAFPFEEATTYERGMKNFQPDAFTKETLPNGEAMTNPDGYRILKKTGSSLFRVYDDKGELIGVAKNELGAMRMAQRKFIDGWHGSPHNFMRFMTQKIGTGEGVQAFGYGLYIAENRKIAEQYKKDLSGYEELTIYTKDGKKKGNALDDLDLEASKYLESGERAAGQFKHNTVYYAKQQAEKAGRMDIVERIESYGRDARTGYEINRGSLYRVQLNVLPEQLLDWDKPLSEQSDGVKAFMNRAAEKVPFDGIIKNADGTLEQDASGRMLYEWLTKQQKGTNKESQVSNLLSKNGIPGIRYLDGGSRATGEGTSNYVIFDDGLIRILDRNGKPVGKRLFRDVAEEGYNVRFQPDDTAKKATKEEKQTGFQPSEFRFQPTKEEFDRNVYAGLNYAKNTLGSKKVVDVENTGKTFIKLANLPSAFITGKSSSSKDVGGIIKDMGLSDSFSVNETGYQLLPTGGYGNVTEINGPSGTAYIFSAGDYVWIDVSKASRQQSGGTKVDTYRDPAKREKQQLGQAAYQVLSFFAKNNGKKIIPDPSGVSAIAHIRRIDNLLAGALKTGDTSYISFGNGPTPPGWTGGQNYVRDIGVLSTMSGEYATHFFPELNLLTLSKDGTKVVLDGKAYTPRDLADHLLVGDRSPAATGVGEKTLRRSILTKLDQIKVSPGETAGLLEGDLVTVYDDKGGVVPDSSVDQARGRFLETSGERIMFQPDDPNNTADAKAAQNTLRTTYFKNQEEFQKAVAEGRVRKANIEDFIGKVVALHQPDNAMVGTVEFNGTTVVVGEGGVYYAVKFGKDGSLWASTKTAAEKTAKALNEIHDANNGKIYMGLTSAPVTKLFSSTNMATGIVDTLAEVSKLSKEYGMTESALNGIITKASKVPFVKKKNGEIVSESRLKVNLDENNSLNENLSLLREVLKPENSSFDNRTTFSGAIANNLAVFFKDKPKESAKFASLILGDSNKYAKASIRKGKLSKDAILQAFGDMFSEGFLKDFQSAKGSGHLYAVLEMDGRVESVHSPNHKSYPFTVKSTSGKKPVVHILDKAMPWQDVVGLAGQEGYVPKELKKSVYPSSGFSTTKHGHLEVRKPREGAVPTLTNIMFQPDPASPNILVGTNGTRIIKSPSGKFRVYSVTGTLLGIRESEQAAQKLATK